MPQLAALMLGLKIAAGTAALGALAWLVDEIGDRREAKVRAALAAEVRAADARAGAAEARWRAHYEAAVAERSGQLAAIRDELAAKPAGQCEISEALRKRLNAINPKARP